MSLSLEDIKFEFREGYLRTEEVLSGMDAYIAKLEKRIVSLEQNQKRINELEGQMAAITAALYQDDQEPEVSPQKIYVG